MVVVASAVLVVPYERLKPDGKFAHPSQDNQIYKDDAEKLKELLEEKFLSSLLWNEGAASWAYGKLKSVAGDPDSWPELNPPRQMATEKRVKSTLKLIRNALSHGSILHARRSN